MIQDFFALQERLWAELDWEGLGGAYCDAEAPDFFDDERQELVRDVGLEVALDLTAHLPGGGRSLYVGAGVAELEDPLDAAFASADGSTYDPTYAASCGEMSRTSRPARSYRPSAFAT